MGTQEFRWRDFTEVGYEWVGGLSHYGLKSCSTEHGRKLSDSVKAKEFLEQLSDQ
jgi:hypothetical protein